MRANVEEEITVSYDGDPEVPATAGQALGEAGINVLGYTCHATADSGVLRLLTADASRARIELEAVGLDVVTQKVLVTPAPHEPGAFGRIVRQLTQQGRTITESYVAMDPHGQLPRLVFAIEGPKEHLKQTTVELRG